MRESVELGPVGLPPHQDVVLRALGVPDGHAVPARVEELVREAQSLYRALARPRGMIASISREEFLELYEGEGRNDSPTPLPGIVSRATRLALFAATLGEGVSTRITGLFAENNAALGSALDAIASHCADAAADLLAQRFLEKLGLSGAEPEPIRVLPYSPGYCGWHITGQRRLFSFLEPERIGITLNESCLMLPVKSVSGVLVAGSPEAHLFENEYEFCLDCATWSCRTRIASLF